MAKREVHKCTQNGSRNFWHFQQATTCSTWFCINFLPRRILILMIEKAGNWNQLQHMDKASYLSSCCSHIKNYLFANELRACMRLLNTFIIWTFFKFSRNGFLSSSADYLRSTHDTRCVFPLSLLSNCPQHMGDFFAFAFFFVCFYYCLRYFLCCCCCC